MDLKTGLLEMKRITKRVTVLSAVGFLLVLTGSDCKTTEPGNITPVPPVITDSGDCAAACANLERLKCEEGAPIDMGKSCASAGQCLGLDGKPDAKQYCGTNGHCMTSCTNFCIDTQEKGVWLDPACVAKITSCDQISTCPTPKKPENYCEGPACPPDIRTK